MKRLFVFIFTLTTISASAQLDTMIVYDLNTQTVEIIAPVEYDASITSDKTASNIGTMTGFTALETGVPTVNLFDDTDFTQLVKTADLFDLTHYPMRTSVKLKGIAQTGQDFECSGSLISENIVITAAHCTFDYFMNIEFFVESMEILPSFDNGELPLDIPSAQVTKVILFKRSFDGNGFYDVCMLLLDEPIGRELGYQGIGFAPTEELTEKVFHKFSYPASESSVDPNLIYNGDTTYYNYGLMSYNTFSGYLFLDSPMAQGIPGQSGSGLFESTGEEQTLFGVMSFSNYQHSRITQPYFHQIKNAIETFGTISSVIDNDEKMNLKISPNPFTEKTIVHIPQKTATEYNYRIIDFNGKIIQQGTGTNSTLTISNDDLISGIYFLSINFQNGEIITDKIIVK